jgi:short-subunit dehydrogenase
MENVFKDIVKSFQTIDCLVTGAGVGDQGELVEQSIQRIQKVVDINVSQICSL